ncbi:MAG TPA: hypothetical protein VFT22_18910 [Kofleriaceae bacterium]|nr:hypothetical protein [Kofleriaceae bacterium]
MPSQLPLPTTRELIEAFRGAVQSERDETADLRSGANYNVWAGVGALLFLREATRDRDIFRSIYFDFAEGEPLDTIGQQRFTTNRVLLAQGTGIAALTRPSASFGADTIWSGTRLAVYPGGSGGVRYYQAAADTPVPATALSVLVPIVSTESGRGVAVNTLLSPPQYMRIEDPLADSSWVLGSVICGDGTDRQIDSDYRAGIRAARLNSRIGYATAITNACIAAGAAQTALFQSDYLSTDPANPANEIIGSINANGYGDVGLNRCFVGDANWNTSPGLLAACKLAIDPVAMAGTALRVLPMAPVSVALTVSATLAADPSTFDTVSIAKDISDAVVNYFATRRNAFYFRNVGIRAAIQRVVRSVQTLTVVTNPTAAPIFSQIPLPRYFVSPGNITIKILDKFGAVFATYSGS